MSKSSQPSRRQFLITTVAGVAGGLNAATAKQVQGANDRLNLGIIGPGGQGQALMRQIAALTDKLGVKIIAVCDVYQKRVEAAAKQTGAQIYKDYRKLLENKDVHAVVIATPDHWHAPMALDAADAGKDIYLEKPMTLTWQEAVQLRRKIKDTRRVLQIGASGCSNPGLVKARELIQKGAIGKVVWSQASYCRNSKEGEWNYRIDPDASPQNLDWDMWLGSAPKRPFSPERYFRWRKYWDYSGGNATDLLYHVLSPLHVVFGPELPARVNANGGIWVHKNDGRDVPDTYLTTIDYPSGHTITLSSVMANDTPWPTVIYGHEGNLSLGNRRGGGSQEITPQRLYQKEHEKRVADGVLEIKVPAGVGHMQNWIECIRSRGKPTCNEEVAYTTMVAIHLGVLSYRHSKTYRFDPEKETVIA
jgi:predicted dehydrogenase